MILNVIDTYMPTYSVDKDMVRVTVKDMRVYTCEESVAFH